MSNETLATEIDFFIDGCCVSVDALDYARPRSTSKIRGLALVAHQRPITFIGIK